MAILLIRKNNFKLFLGVFLCAPDIYVETVIK